MLQRQRPASSRKPLLTLAVALPLAVLLASCGPQNSAHPDLVVGSAPLSINGPDLKGKPVSLSQYKGKVVLLDFWATWCGPCLEDLPKVSALYHKYHAQGLEVIGISLDPGKSDLENFLKTHKDITWTQIPDLPLGQNSNAVRYKAQSIPFTLLIGRDGKIAAVDPFGESLEPAVQAALAAQP